ncbi:hypothetical protein O1611_g1358 [Lasiodiplodia mahajangana]|uniref:Uncharacterized protein n=1 Tax=Lasiodiplodia mahajangana TaxID=1108764 RepID=A0ACC2JXR9_9PEZI|nr:hypothetical protein O1611_g1358 [Lasiodiplodia mahajangana]
MGAGLDELIESLLTEIAFSGVRGCSVSNLLVAIDSFYKPSDRNDEPQQAANTHDLAVASKVWKWLADRPRLHVSEERQWRTIAGHGPDLKRVPLFEWRALVDIASVKEKGILQGDLVRLTGQDKRSLPTRTDALARKGYIIKQPIVLRGGKSSKLWLAQFAEDAKEHQEREGLDYDRLDLSRSALTSDLHPVPFCDKWNGDNIDYLALAQAFVAIVKAWSLIRYCDARAKLGVEERVRQMRALAKTCRWLTNIGALSFVGAKFAGSNRLFKDCVKYIRDPSPAEWSHFRATPKTRMVVPSGRIGKRGEASRAVHASQIGSRAVHVVPQNVSRGKAAGKKSQRTNSHSTKSRNDPASYTRIIPSPWKPQKPVPNTAFEIIKRAGSKGTSNAAICRQTLGPNYRRLTAAMTGSISMPTNSQPPHLKHLSSASQLSRIGKTMTYTFYANSEITETGPSDQQVQSHSTNIDTVLANATNSAAENKYSDAFSQLDMARFSAYPGSPLTDIVQSQRSNRVLSRASKRKRPTDEELDDQPPVKLPRRLGRPPAKRVTNKLLSGSTEEHALSETGDAPSTAQKVPIDQQTPTRLPGVYRGAPNSLDPVAKRKGRRRKSLVIIFRSDKLKDPSFLRSPSAVPEVHSTNNSSPEATVEATPSRQSIQVEDLNPEDNSSAIIVTPRVAREGLRAQSGTPKAGKHGSFLCEKCGNSWKNSNGLEYHLTKSRTSCNPDFVPPPGGLIADRKRKSIQPRVLEGSSVPQPVPQEPGQSRQNLTPQQQMESRFEGKKRPSTSRPQKASSVASSVDGGTTYASNIGDTPQPQAFQSSIILKDLEVYDANDHQRLLNQRKSFIDRGASAGDKIPIALDPRLFNATTLSNSRIHNLGINNQGEQENTLSYSPNTDKGKARYLAKDQPYPTSNNASVPEHPGKSRDGVPILTPIDRSGVRKPLPTIPSNKSETSSTSLPTPARYPSANNPSDHEMYPEALLDPALAQQPTHKPLAFFAKPTRPNASFGARRRDRTTQIIEYLLEQNDGVFPGLRSLFMAIISVWAKEFKDLAPPDRRICQNTVNHLERDGVIKQMHFYFFDDQGKMQECVVLAKADPNSKLAVDSSDDPRVIAVKEKMREMFPEAYVPDAFSLSPDEAKLFDQLASQGKEHSQSRNLKIPKDLKRVQDIETLRYENSVMGDISIHRNNNTKRQMDEIQDENQTPSKRTRVDVENLESLERARKPRRRPDKHEMWDSGKLAVYIWSQRQMPSVTWDQDRSSLQDPTTGAWSWTPDTDPSPLSRINTILSSVKSARHIDASLKRKGRRRLAGIDPNARGNKRHNYRNHSHGAPINSEDVLMTDGIEYRGFDGSTLRSLIPFGTDSLSDEGTEALYEDGNEIFDNEDASLGPTGGIIGADNQGPWWDTANPIMVERMPSTRRPSSKHSPRDVQDILNTIRRAHSLKGWADPAYGKFLQCLDAIKKWEQSANGSRHVTSGTIAPNHEFISLTLEETKANLKGTNIEWLSSNQFTIDNIPNEVKNASPKDDEYGLSYLMKNSKKSEPKTNGYRVTNNEKHPSQPQTTTSHFSTLPPHPDGFIEYKTRDLTIIPKQPRGRFNKPSAHDDKLGSKREDELVAACVVFRTLLGGLDRNLDIGLLLKHFPGMSLSALKKFWPRISRERKSYVQALTAKFQSEFLEAYESGKLPPLDYDDIENYDWPKLILWATQLETHEDVDLPESRDKLHEKYSVEDVANEDVDWRETWFATTSTYNRIEAVASETMSIPLPIKDQQDRAILERARTWVRSICCTSLRGVNVRDYLIPKLLELGNGDAAETNRILEKAVSELNREKVITRTKGKDIGGNFRIHGMFSKQLEKLAATPKFRQAIAFKTQLDEVFRHTEEYIMPYASDDGSIMAALNLQAHGRIRIDTIDMPNIPFGFEPGNYEGRTFPKSYYHFKVRLVPTDTYLFNEDMALLDQARHTEPPTQGLGGKIPIWVDFFGKVDAARWADYVSMIVFTLATKGPIVPKMCVTLLRPMIDEFEVQLIVDWLDKLGLIQQAVHGCGVTGAEWWWLVAGHIVQLGDKVTGKQKVFEIGT